MNKYFKLFLVSLLIAFSLISFAYYQEKKLNEKLIDFRLQIQSNMNEQFDITINNLVEVSEVYTLIRSLNSNQSIIKNKVDEHDKILNDMLEYVKTKKKGRL